MEATVKCLRIYATRDGESHFGEADVPTTEAPLFPGEAPFALSSHYAASRIRFVRIPAGGCVLVEDTHGKGHISRHPAEGQSLILFTLTNGPGSATVSRRRCLRQPH